jgi:hypothetical protein
VGKDFEKIILKLKGIEGAVCLNIINYKVNRVPDQWSWNNLKNVRDNSKEGSQNKMPFVLEQVFIQVFKFFHAAKILQLGLKRNILWIVQMMVKQTTNL